MRTITQTTEKAIRFRLGSQLHEGHSYSFSYSNYLFNECNCPDYGSGSGPQYVQ